MIATAVAVGAEPFVTSVPSIGPWPWIGLMALLLAAPFFAQFRRHGSTEPFAPVTFPVWTYMAPVWIVGSAMLVAGLTQQPMAPGLIPEPTAPYFTLALAYVAIGWLGLLLGFFSPFGVTAGEQARRWLPDIDWAPAETRLPAALLLLAGIGCYLLAYRNGLIGHQRPATPGRFDALLIYAGWLGQVAAFILWSSLFRVRRWGRAEWLLSGVLILLGPAYLVITASRAALLTYLLVVAAAYRFSGRPITVRSVLAFFLLAAFSVGAGTVWGTMYRLVKGDEEPLASATAPPPPDADAAAAATGTPLPDVEATPEPGITPPPVRTSGDLISDTVQRTTEQGLATTLSFSLRTLGQRIEIASSVAVVVANYRRLRPQEERHGIAGNIWRDTWTSVIPRALWPGKPLVSDARTYSLIYFQNGQNSYAMTPMGDLLRNFGPAGIALGMALLGVALRALYRLLIEAQPVRTPRAAVFVPLLMTVSYEGFYGVILPTAMRVGIIAVAGVVCVHVGVLVLRRLQVGTRAGADATR